MTTKMSFAMTFPWVTDDPEVEEDEEEEHHHVPTGPRRRRRRLHVGPGLGVVGARRFHGLARVSSPEANEEGLDVEPEFALDSEVPAPRNSARKKTTDDVKRPVRRVRNTRGRRRSAGGRWTAHDAPLGLLRLRRLSGACRCPSRRI